ncbi:MAG: hypothetical protein P4M11_15625 [Candidatus Pacebacteria bacterium]|nr:hypothetical protein [Candidatus Paceibacterota bacterium]
MVFLIAASVVIIYQVAAYVYFFVSVSLVYSSTRKIAKMGGLSLFFVIFNIYSLTLFYPTTLSYFMFVAPTGERGVGHPDKIDGTYMTYGSAGHIVVSVVVIFLWSVALIVQAATALLTTELSSQRLVSWSSVEPYTRLAIMIIKIYQSVMLCFFVWCRTR